MADLSITATSVLAVAGSTNKDSSSNFTGTVTAGQSVHFDGTGWKAADSDASAVAAGSGGVGIALNGGATGQPAVVARSGPYIAGGTVVVGKIYVVSATAGGIAPSTDLASTMYTTILGIGISATQIQLNPMVSGVQVP